MQIGLTIERDWSRSAVASVLLLMHDISHKVAPAVFSQAEFCKAYGEFITQETLKSFLLLRLLRLVPSGFGGYVGGFGIWWNPVKNRGRYINNHTAKIQAPSSLWSIARQSWLTFERRTEPSASCRAQTKCPLPFTSHRAGFPLGSANKQSLEVPPLTFSALWISHLKPGGVVCGQLCSDCQILFSVGFAWMQRDQCGGWWWKPFEHFWQLKWENSRGHLYRFSGRQSARWSLSLTTNLHVVA